MTSLSSLAELMTKDYENGSKESLVKDPSGKFYHYCCDGFNDTGWGCGYRSLQTMCSWALLNRPSTTAAARQVPTLVQIQETLVEVGDKEQPFVNSREWIGCYEASIVLDQLYEISSKILHVTSGSKVTEVCGQLLTHFETIGSPIMIGGDEDASSKTLIGIAVNEDTSTWTFLIADPHYIGGDSVKAIVDSKGIQWNSRTESTDIKIKKIKIISNKNLSVGGAKI